MSADSGSSTSRNARRPAGVRRELTDRERRAIEAGVKTLPRPMNARREMAFRQACAEFAIPEHIVNAAIRLARERALH
jgi:hypothetical protein